MLAAFDATSKIVLFFKRLSMIEAFVCKKKDGKLKASKDKYVALIFLRIWLSFPVPFFVLVIQFLSSHQAVRNTFGTSGDPLPGLC